MSFKDILKKSFFESYATTEITYQYVLISLLLCALIAIVICSVYYFKSRQYFFSKEFAVSLMALSLITTAIILTIQSSVVISLGMVGALSIVRFRTAIKNPLDLVFLFWSISVGIICGAGLYYIAFALTLILGVLMLISDEIPGVQRNKILVLDGRYPYKQKELEKILKKHVKYWHVRTESLHNEEVNLIIEIRNLKNTTEMIREIKALGTFHSISVLVQEGVID